MNEGLLQSAKREPHAILASRPALAAILAAGVVAGLTGPFGTVDTLTLLPRLGYWLVVCAMTYITGAVLITVAMARLVARGWPRWAAAVAATVPAGLVIAVEVALVNWTAFARPPTAPGQLAALALNGTAIALVITFALMIAIAEARGAGRAFRGQRPPRKRAFGCTARTGSPPIRSAPPGARAHAWS